MCRWYCKYQKVGQAWMRGKADDCMNQHSVCWLLDLLIGLWKHGTPQGRFSVFVLLWRNEQRKRWCMKAKIIWGGRSTGSRRNSAPSRFASVNSHTSSWTSPSRWAIIVSKWDIAWGQRNFHPSHTGVIYAHLCDAVLDATRRWWRPWGGVGRSGKENKIFGDPLNSIKYSVEYRRKVFDRYACSFFSRAFLWGNLQEWSSSTFYCSFRTSYAASALQV